MAHSVSLRVRAFLERYARRERAALTRPEILANFEKYGIQPCETWIEFEEQWGGTAFQNWQFRLDYEETALDDGRRLMGFADYRSAPCFLLMDDRGKLYAWFRPEDFGVIIDSFNLLLEQEALLDTVKRESTWFVRVSTNLDIQDFPGIYPVLEATDSRTQWWSNEEKTLWLQKTSLWGDSDVYISAYAPDLNTLRPFLMYLSQHEIEAFVRPVAILYPEK